MLRFVFGVVAAFWLAFLILGGMAAAAGVAVVLLAPLVILIKVAFVGMLLGFFFRRAGGWGCHRPRERFRPERGRRYTNRRRSDRPDAHERFQEWHDLEHARREVDSWTTYDL